MSSKAFGLTAYYDAMIANWFNNKLNIRFPERKTIFGRKLSNLRYGENPHQESSIYVSDYDDKKLGLKQLHGKELSYNNYNDLFAGLEILQSFKGIAATVVIKHANPCGISINKQPLVSFINAYKPEKELQRHFTHVNFNGFFCCWRYVCKNCWLFFISRPDYVFSHKWGVGNFHSNCSS